MKNIETDVIVVAAGLSGLAAAISAAENGAISIFSLTFLSKIVFIVASSFSNNKQNCSKLSTGNLNSGNVLDNSI